MYRVCHENVRDVEDIKKCSCKKLAKARFEYFQSGKENMDQRNGWVVDRLGVRLASIVLCYRHGHGPVLGRREGNEGGLRQRKPEVDDIPEDDGSEAAQVFRLLSAP